MAKAQKVNAGDALAAAARRYAATADGSQGRLPGKARLLADLVEGQRLAVGLLARLNTMTGVE